MGWEERLREAAYTSPSGVRQTFGFEDVSKEVDRRTPAFEFAEVDGALIQDRGRGPEKFPLQCIFSGDDYDIEAKAFEALLNDTGVGKLEHPIYGVHNVVPFGAINRSDRLVSAGNQGIITLVFMETNEMVFPTADENFSSAALQTVLDFNEAEPEQFEQDLDIQDTTDQVGFEQAYDIALAAVNTVMEPIADANAEVGSLFNSINTSITTSIGTLIDDPLTLARQTIALIQTPARSSALFSTRLDGYRNLLRGLIGGTDDDGTGTGTPPPPPEPIPATATFTDRTFKNKFTNDILFSKTIVTGMVLSAVNNEFTTAPEALQAADDILSLFDDLTIWIDDRLEQINTRAATLPSSQQTNLQIVDTGQAYQQMQQAVAVTAGFLVKISFSLKQERELTLIRPRTIIDLCAEFYGEIDPQLDFFINSNNLSGDEILLIPTGRTVKYYV